MLQDGRIAPSAMRHPLCASRLAPFPERRSPYRQRGWHPAAVANQRLSESMQKK